MTHWRTPNFRGSRALVLHAPDRNTAALRSQLEKLGVQVTVEWPEAGADAAEYDVVFFDADCGFDGLFPWSRGEAPLPLVAMTGSEAPGRLEWMLAQNPSGFIEKPIGSHGAFQSLVVAFHFFERERALVQTIRTQEERIKARPLVVRAILLLMRKYGVGDDEAFRMLRRQAMERQIPVEDAAQTVVVDDEQHAPESGWDGELPSKAADRS